ncbi:MAG: hypothetical protein KDD11_09475 [Acidobacteria bacterium]|nr:hypothetical protein [Acidobacteriota bacterium]
MCCDPLVMRPEARRAVRIRRSSLALACTLVALLATAGCGKKGDPVAPLRAIPKAVDDLALRQQGTDLVLEFTYPSVTLGGTAVPGLDQVEVVELDAPAPPKGLTAPVEPRQVSSAGKVVAVLKTADLAAATSGNRVYVRLPVPTPPEDEPVRMAAFGVRSTASNGEVSGISNIVALVPQTAPEPPRDLQLIPTPEGLRIDWTFAGDDPEGFNVYRRDVRSRAYRRPLRQVGGDARSYLDPTARFGERYIYTVTTVSSRDPLVESKLSGEAEAFYQDRFSPEPPTALVALAEVGQVRLRWDPSTSPDVVAYHVYRKRPEGDFRRLTTEPVAGREYLDTTTASGQTVTYRITGVDRQGNEGEPGEEVTVIVR